MVEYAHPSILPHDGRFGSGPTKIRSEQLSTLAAAPLGTSHRAQPVRSLVGSVREGLAELFALPDGYEIALGNGGASLVWEALTFSLVQKRAAHAVCGEFSAKFADLTDGAPHLDPSVIARAEVGTFQPLPEAPDADTLAFAHNETSTGVLSPLHHAEAAPGQLVVVDATSVAGALDVHLAGIDVYYFSPQKALGADGGLWFAILSPAAIERIEAVCASRWVPPMLDLARALAASRKNQTYNTPSIVNLALLDSQVRWLRERGGLAWAEERCRNLSGALYTFAESHPLVRPFVTEPAYRSPVVATLDIDESINADDVRARLTELAGIVDIAPYRKLGRNQIRVGCFPAVERHDLDALIAWLEWALEDAADA
ncbi:MAG: phosphoserine transaminase [Bowdeniella nasicola]|nr:phosphoserine transaminase [Bowdeniella nasicola]